MFLDMTERTAVYLKDVVEEEKVTITKRCWLAFYLFTAQPSLFIMHFIIRPLLGLLIYNRTGNSKTTEYFFILKPSI